MTPVFERVLHDPGETFALGQALGELLEAGDFVALAGALGSGKTQFIKGLAAGLGVSPDEPVVSPTFVLIREYVGRLKLYHIDAYRLAAADELLALGLAEMMAEPAAVVAVEWADRVTPAVPNSACSIDLEHAGPTDRRLRMTWPAAVERLARLAG